MTDHLFGKVHVHSYILQVRSESHLSLFTFSAYCSCVCSVETVACSMHTIRQCYLVMTKCTLNFDPLVSVSVTVAQRVL